MSPQPGGEFKLLTTVLTSSIIYFFLNELIVSKFKVLIFDFLLCTDIGVVILFRCEIGIFITLFLKSSTAPARSSHVIPSRRKFLSLFITRKSSSIIFSLSSSYIETPSPSITPTVSVFVAIPLRGDVFNLSISISIRFAKLLEISDESEQESNNVNGTTNVLSLSGAIKRDFIFAMSLADLRPKLLIIFAILSSIISSLISSFLFKFVAIVLLTISYIGFNISPV